jgi:hypothetical protein
MSGDWPDGYAIILEDSEAPGPPPARHYLRGCLARRDVRESVQDGTPLFLARRDKRGFMELEAVA